MGTRFLLTIKHVQSAKRVAVVEFGSDNNRDWYRQADTVFSEWCLKRRRYRKDPASYKWTLFVHACSQA